MSWARPRSLDGKNVQVSSKVFLLSGQTYTVVWRLGWRGGRYKVTDVKVLGFSLVYLQRGIFTSFVKAQRRRQPTGRRAQPLIYGSRACELDGIAALMLLSCHDSSPIPRYLSRHA